MEWLYDLLCLRNLLGTVLSSWLLFLVPWLETLSVSLSFGSCGLLLPTTATLGLLRDWKVRKWGKGDGNFCIFSLNIYCPFLLLEPEILEFWSSFQIWLLPFTSQSPETAVSYILSRCYTVVLSRKYRMGCAYSIFTWTGNHIILFSS